MTRSSVAPKIVTVFASTGSQGSSVVRSLLQNKNFHVRAITRKPESKAAQALRALGAEIIQADGWQKDEIAAAFKGSWAAFVNTNSEDPYFDNSNGPTEYDLGKTIIDGIVEAGTVQHLVYSSAVSTLAFSDGQIYAKAAEMKTRIGHYATMTRHFKSVSHIYAGFYMELFESPELTPVFGGFPYVPDSDNFLTITTPRWGKDTDVTVPWIGIREDFGDIVHGVLLEPEMYDGKVVPALSDPCSFPGVADAFQSATGKKARYICQPSWEDFGAGISQLEDQRQLFRFGQLTDGKYFGDEPTDTAIPAYLKARAVEARGGDPKTAQLLTLEEWFKKKF
ncbi:hypothetical protein BDV12DRAFT_190432 [Aspergillus spectabilis]